jgi:hypothetical protein
MILFDDVVEVFDLTDLDARVSFGIVALIAAPLAQLSSIVIFSGVPFHLMALRKNRSYATQVPKVHDLQQQGASGRATRGTASSCTRW